MELITLTESNADSFLLKISGQDRDRHILIDGGYRQDARRALALIESIIEEHKKNRSSCLDARRYRPYQWSLSYF